MLCVIPFGTLGDLKTMMIELYCFWDLIKRMWLDVVSGLCQGHSVSLLVFSDSKDDSIYMFLWRYVGGTGDFSSTL